MEPRWNSKVEGRFFAGAEASRYSKLQSLLARHDARLLKRHVSDDKHAWADGCSVYEVNLEYRLSFGKAGRVNECERALKAQHKVRQELNRGVRMSKGEDKEAKGEC